MLLTIVSYRLPGLTGVAHTALLAALALAVTVCMAIVGGYAMHTMPQAEAVRA